MFPVTVSVHDFLPSLVDRKENIVFCHFIVKREQSERTCTTEEMTSAMMELDRKPAKNIACLVLKLKKV